MHTMVFVLYGISEHVAHVYTELLWGINIRFMTAANLNKYDCNRSNTRGYPSLNY